MIKSEDLHSPTALIAPFLNHTGSSGLVRPPGIPGGPGKVLEFEIWSKSPGKDLDFLKTRQNVLEKNYSSPGI